MERNSLPFREKLFEFLANLFVRLRVVFLSAIIQFGFLEFLFFKFDCIYNDSIQRIAFYGTMLSVLLLAYASLSAYKYLRNRGSNHARINFQNILISAYGVYLAVLVLLLFSLF